MFAVGARLEAHEVVKPKYALGTKQGRGSENGTVFRKVYGEHGEFVMMNRNTHVTFSIPYDAPASFSTDVVEIRWLIHFVFLIPQPATKLKASRLAGSVVLDDDEGIRLLDELEIQPEDSSEEDVPGWEGGAWAGEDPSNWKQILAEMWMSCDGLYLYMSPENQTRSGELEIAVQYNSKQVTNFDFKKFSFLLLQSDRVVVLTQHQQLQFSTVEREQTH